MENSKEYKYIFSSYEPANWYTNKGAYKMLCKYEKMGLPDFKQGHLITLTVKPEKFDNDPIKAYEDTRYIIHRLIYDLKQVYGHFEYLYKIEFQGNGFVHYHIITDIKQKLHRKDFKRWNEKNIGNIDFELIKGNAKKVIHYVLKYVCKGGILPLWVRDYKKQIRFTAKSKGFFTNELKKEIKKDIKEAEKKAKKRPFLSIDEKLKSWASSALLVININNQKKFYKVKTSLYDGFNQVATFLNLSICDYHTKAENSDINLWKKSFLHKAWIFRDRARFNNIEVLAFLFANGAISSLPHCLTEELKKYLYNKEKLREYKSLATKQKYQCFELVEFVGGNSEYFPTNKIDILQEAC